MDTADRPGAPPSDAPSLRIAPSSWLDPLPLASLYPHPERPMEVDVGFGKGRFLLARANRFPEVNFLGIERLLGRLRKVDAKAARAGLGNLRLLRMEAYYAMAYLMPEGCVRTLYVFFPDPWPKQKHHKHRLMGPAFVDAAWRALEPGGRLYFTTDHGGYFDEATRGLADDARFNRVDGLALEAGEQTDFERLYAGQKTIHRAGFAKK